jgi:hypothetical protein
MAIFKCIDDPTSTIRLQLLGITDLTLMKYVVDRARGMSSDEALSVLLHGKDPSSDNARYVAAIVRRFPIPSI